MLHSEKQKHLRIILNDQTCQRFSNNDIEMVFEKIDPDYAQVLIASILLSGNDNLKDLIERMFIRIVGNEPQEQTNVGDQ